jgi:O-antigen ligase
VYYPFVVPKVIYFRTLIELVAVLLVSYAVYTREGLHLAIFKKKITWVPLVFLGFSYLSALVGLDFYHSFWSIFERMDGLVTLTHLIAYFYAVLLVFNKEDWHKFFVINGVVAVLVGLYAVLQHYGFSWFQDTADVRVRGTIGNAAFLASYLGIMFFLALYLAREAKTVLMRRMWWCTAGLSLIVILLTQTRGAIVAGGVSLVVFLVWWALTTSEKKYKRYAIVGLVLVALLGIFGYAYRTSLRSSSIPAVARIASISLSDPTTKSRLFIWENSLSAFTEHPILGYGMENFEYVYNQFYDPQMIAEEWFDRSHNVYIDQLIHNGAVGFVLYLVMLLYALYVAWGYVARDKYVGFVFFFLLLTYALQNFFVFDALSSAFLFWAIFAFLIYVKSISWGDSLLVNKGQNQSKGTPWMRMPVIIVMVVGAGASWYFVNYLPLRANIALGEGYKYQIADVKKSLASFEKGLAYNTFADMEYGYQTYSTYINKLEYRTNLKNEEMVKSYEAASVLFKNLIEKYPWNVRLYTYWGHIVESRPEGISYDEEEFEALMKKATELSPKRSTAYYIWSNIYLAKLKDARTNTEKQELYSKGLEVLKLYATRAQNSADAQFVVADVAQKAGRLTEAQEFFEKGANVYTSSLTSARRAAGYLLRTNDYVRAERYLEDIARVDGGNPNVWFDLAKVYYLNGKFDLAVQALNKVNAINPELLKKEPALVNQILNSVR